MPLQPQLCTIRRRCRQPRECTYCATARQKRLADIAERLLSTFPDVEWHRLSPDDNTAAALRTAKTAYLRGFPGLGGVWTIEQGSKFAKLHINFLTPPCEPHRPRRAELHIERVTSRLREVAAYISKREGIPDPVHFDGKTFGTFGNLPQIMRMSIDQPLIAATQVEHDLSELTSPANASALAPTIHPPAACRVADYHEIARRNLPRLHALVHQFKR